MKVSEKPFLGTAGLNVVIDNPDIVTTMVSALIGSELVQLFYKPVQSLPQSECSLMENIT
jgi:hypothetical protein